MPAPTDDFALATKTLAPVESVDVSVYTVPTDGPEADSALAWDHTTMVLVQAHAQGVTGLGWAYGSPATAHVITGELNDAVNYRAVPRRTAPYRVVPRSRRGWATPCRVPGLFPDNASAGGWHGGRSACGPRRPLDRAADLRGARG